MFPMPHNSPEGNTPSTFHISTSSCVIRRLRFCYVLFANLGKYWLQYCHGQNLSRVVDTRVHVVHVVDSGWARSEQ